MKTSSAAAVSLGDDDVQELRSGPSFLVADANITELKTRLFSAGPTDFQFRLKSIDSRMDELESQAGSCVSATAQEWAVPVGTSGIPLATMYFQCSFSVTGTSGVSDYKIFFGKKDGFWYLAELQINSGLETGSGEPPTMAVLAKIADDSTTVEAYQISLEKISGTYHTSVTQILANKTTMIFEVSTASTATSSQVASSGANMTGLGCGVQMKTDGTNIFGSGVFSQATSCPSSATPCVLASDFGSSGTCTSINTFSSVAMTRTALSSAGAANVAKAIIVDKTGMPSVTSL